MVKEVQEKEVKITKAVVETVNGLASELIKLIGQEITMDVVHDKEADAVLVNLESPDSAGLIIGRRGETVLAIQYVLGMMVRTALDGWVRIVVNVGDWREKQEEQLIQMAKQTAERARETGEPQMLYNLNPSQRRVIHIFLANEKDIETLSEGEGNERHLVVSQKK